MSTAGAESAQLVDQNLFRDVMGRFASGVTVITTRANDADHGTDQRHPRRGTRRRARCRPASSCWPR